MCISLSRVELRSSSQRPHVIYVESMELGSQQATNNCASPFDYYCSTCSFLLTLHVTTRSNHMVVAAAPHHSHSIFPCIVVILDQMHAHNIIQTQHAMPCHQFSSACLTSRFLAASAAPAAALRLRAPASSVAAWAAMRYIS